MISTYMSKLGLKIYGINVKVEKIDNSTFCILKLV